MTTPREVMQMALEALESLFNWQVDHERGKRCGDAVAALRAVLEQPEQEPVAWMSQAGNFLSPLEFTVGEAALYGWTPVYTTTPAPQRKPLTDADIKLVMNGRGEEGDDAYIKPAFDPYGISEDDLLGFARAIEQAHGIKDGS